MMQTSQGTTKELLSVVETAHTLGIAPRLVTRLADAGILPAILFGRRRKFSLMAIHDFFRAYEGQDVLQVLEEREAAK